MFGKALIYQLLPSICDYLAAIFLECPFFLAFHLGFISPISSFSNSSFAAKWPLGGRSEVFCQPRYWASRSGCQMWGGDNWHGGSQSKRGPICGYQKILHPDGYKGYKQCRMKSGKYSMYCTYKGIEFITNEHQEFVLCSSFKALTESIFCFLHWNAVIAFVA